MRTPGWNRSTCPTASAAPERSAAARIGGIEIGRDRFLDQAGDPPLEQRYRGFLVERGRHHDADGIEVRGQLVERRRGGRTGLLGHLARPLGVGVDDGDEIRAGMLRVDPRVDAAEMTDAHDRDAERARAHASRSGFENRSAPRRANSSRRLSR